MYCVYRGLSQASVNTGFILPSFTISIIGHANMSSDDLVISKCVLVVISHLHKPLIGQVRLNRRLPAVAVGEIDFTVFAVGLRIVQAERVEVGHHRFAGLRHRQAAVLFGDHLGERAVGSRMLMAPMAGLRCHTS